MSAKTNLRIKIPLYLTVAISLLAVSCKKELHFADEPAIILVSHVTSEQMNALGVPVYNTLITFSFTDGDGDLGLNDTQIEPPYDFNMYISRIPIKAGIAQEAEMINFRIPELSPGPGNNAIQGELDVELEIIVDFFPEDTVRYELYILDRALNQSNTIVTSDIPL